MNPIASIDLLSSSDDEHNCGTNNEFKVASKKITAHTGELCPKKFKKDDVSKQNVITLDGNSSNEENVNSINLIEKTVPIDDQKQGSIDNVELEDQELEIFSSNDVMKEFVKVCFNLMSNTEMRALLKSKLVHFKKVFTQLDDDFKQSDEFKNELSERLRESREDGFMAISNFRDIYLCMKKCVKENKLNRQTAEAETSNDNSRAKFIRKLEITFKKVNKKIEELEQREVDFDEEENSSFMILSRYHARSMQIYKQLCKYKNCDPNHILVKNNRLDFSASKVTAFNIAINRWYKKYYKFPTYSDVESCLRTAMDENKIEMTDGNFKREAKHCFEEFGNLLQRRRKADLLAVHSSYLNVVYDPALDNTLLEAKLKANYKSGMEKLNAVCEKYVQLQEDGKEMEISSDSDDSEFISSEENCDGGDNQQQ